jgi:hypothetical protein
MRSHACTSAAIGASLLILACSGPALTDATGGAPAFSRAPVESPLLVLIDDVNACNGLPITLTYAGTAQLQEFDGHSLLHVNGTVTTSDGYTGTFNWTFIFEGDLVGHVVAHDMEVSDLSGQRILFAVGLDHVTAVDGQIVVTFSHFSHERIRCLGQPAG